MILKQPVQRHKLGLTHLTQYGQRSPALSHLYSSTKVAEDSNMISPRLFCKQNKPCPLSLCLQVSAWALDLLWWCFIWLTSLGQYLSWSGELKPNAVEQVWLHRCQRERTSSLSLLTTLLLIQPSLRPFFPASRCYPCPQVDQSFHLVWYYP